MYMCMLHFACGRSQGQGLGSHSSEALLSRLHCLHSKIYTSGMHIKMVHKTLHVAALVNLYIDGCQLHITCMQRNFKSMH